jgi:hypothetical protein
VDTAGLPLISKRFTPIGTKLLYERIMVSPDNFDLLYRTIVEESGHHLALLVKGVDFDAGEFEETPLVDGELITLILHFPRIEYFRSHNASGNRIWLSYPITASPSMSNLTKICVEDLNEVSLSFLLGSYKSVKTMILSGDSNEYREVEVTEPYHIPNKLFRRRELDSLEFSFPRLSRGVSYRIYIESIKSKLT